MIAGEVVLHNSCVCFKSNVGAWICHPSLQNKIKEYKNYRTVAISNPALLLYVYRGFVQHKVGWERDVFNVIHI